MKVLVQYQLYFINVTWYQFLSKTSFGQNEEWPSVQPTTRQTRRRSSGYKVVEENIEQNLKYLKDDNPFQSVFLENRLMEEKSQPDKVEISSNEQLVHRNPILDKWFGESIQGITINSVYVDQMELKFKKPNPAGVRRVMRSTTILSSIPITIQQNTKPIVVELEDDVLSLIPEETHINEHIPIMENI